MSVSYPPKGKTWRLDDRLDNPVFLSYSLRIPAGAISSAAIGEILIMQDKITIKGAREHNLKNISLELPRNKMIVFTGVS